MKQILIWFDGHWNMSVCLVDDTSVASISDRLHVSWYVSLKQNKYQVQVSWYFFAEVSVSVSVIHLGCISISNNWYIPNVSLILILLQKCIMILDTWYLFWYLFHTLILSHQFNIGFFRGCPWPGTWRSGRFLRLLHTTIRWCCSERCWERVHKLFEWHGHWIDNAVEIHQIKTVLTKYNTTLPSSAPVERLFITAGQIEVPRRNLLSDSMFKKLLLLKVNQK